MQEDGYPCANVNPQVAEIRHEAAIERITSRFSGGPSHERFGIFLAALSILGGASAARGEDQPEAKNFGVMI